MVRTAGDDPGGMRRTNIVVHMTSVHQPDDTRIFLKECRTLAAAGYEVHLIAPDAADNVESGVRLWSVRRPGSGRRLARMTATTLQAYRRAASLDADLYHFHDPELMPVALLLARTGARVIYDAHEDLAAAVADKSWIRPGLRSLVARFIERAEPAAANCLSAVVTATPAIERRFARCRCPVVTVNNYPQLSEFQDVPRRVRLGEPAVCYVGAITEIRGIETVIKAIGMTNARLLLAGSFDPPSLRDRLCAMAEWSHVESLGAVGRSEVGEIFARSVAGIVTFRPAANHLRSQPTKLFEYMSAGLPVIASSFALWREIIESSQCGICVDPTSSEALADAIRWITSHPREAHEMGENGRRAVQATYNWEVEGGNLLALYGSLLGRKP